MDGKSGSRAPRLVAAVLGLAVCSAAASWDSRIGPSSGSLRPVPRPRPAAPECALPAADPVTRTYSQDLAAGWNLVSLGVRTGADPMQLFGPHCEAVRRWDPASGSYVTPGSLDPGEGCEVQMSAASQVTLSGTPVAAPLTLPTQRGWEQVGNPYSIPVPWAQVRALRGAVVKTMPQAAKAGWIGRADLVVDGVRRRVDYAKDVLAVGQGAWLKVKGDGVSLRFETQKQWTVMAYLDGDDSDMNTDFSNAFEAMAADKVGSDELVSLVVQFDRIPGNPKFGGWPITHRFFVTPGMEPTEANAIQDWGDGRGGREVEMNDPQSLSAFIAWAAKNYPAQRYVLLVGDHGFGWQGLCIDWTSYGDSMPLKGLASVLASSPVHFDILALDLCSMGNAEVYREIQGAPADVVVGSEAPGRVWPLWDDLRIPMENPGVGSEEWAARMVDLYADYNHGQGSEDVTMAAFRLPAFAAVTPAVRALSEACMDEGLKDEVPARAQAVRDALAACRIHERHGSAMPDTAGLGVYFPQLEEGFIPAVYNCCYQKEAASFVEDALWRHVLMSYYMKFGGMYVDPRFARARLDIHDFDGGDYVDLDVLCKMVAEAGER